MKEKSATKKAHRKRECERINVNIIGKCAVKMNFKNSSEMKMLRKKYNTMQPFNGIPFWRAVQNYPLIKKFGVSLLFFRSYSIVFFICGRKSSRTNEIVRTNKEIGPLNYARIIHCEITE